MRFQPRTGQLLAAAADNIVSIFDVEADRQTHSLQVLLIRHCSLFHCGLSFPLLKILVIIMLRSFPWNTNNSCFGLWHSQGHTKEVHSVCWDVNGEYLASVSQDSVRVWSLASGECTHELGSSGNKFHSCVFHPNYSTLLVVGGYQVIIQLDAILWVEIVYAWMK